MNIKQIVFFPLIYLFPGLSSLLVYAQPVNVSELTELSPFTASAERASRYQPTDTLSSSRIAVQLVDVSQSISVVPRSLIDDTGTHRIFDALKYVSGVSESTLPGAIDRITLRGFQTDNVLIDNFFHSSQANIDPVLIDRIEVAKGPSSIMNPSGPAGGTINNISKSPLFHREGYFKLQLGQYDANRIEADVTGPFQEDGKLAYRMVFAVEDSKSYHDNTFTKSIVAMPMLSWRPTPRVEATVKYLYFDWERPPFLGYPVSPLSTTDNDAIMLEGVPRKRSLQTDREVRKELRHQIFSTLTANFSENFSMRLALNGLYSPAENQQLVNSGNTWGGRDPQTGKWVSGVSFDSNPPFAATPLVGSPGRVFNVSGSKFINSDRRYNLQNDFVYTYEGENFSSTTVAGFFLNYEKLFRDNFDTPVSPIDVDNPDYTRVPTVGANWRKETVDTTKADVFLSQQLKLLNDRLHLSGSYTHVATSTTTLNELTNPPTTTTNRSGDEGFFSWGILAKPMEGLSVYVSRSKNAAPVAIFGLAPNTFAFRQGVQDEAGFKWVFNEGRTFISGAIFDISVNNFVFFNPAAVGSSDPNIPSVVIGNFVSDGFELEFSTELARQWTLLGNISRARFRDQNGIRQRGSADDSAGLFVRYDFDPEQAQGYFLTLGVDYLGRRPGDTGSGFTPASSAGNIILNQPSFYLGARTLLNLGGGYQSDRWRFDVFVQNALDNDHIAASINRNLAVTGHPINVKGSITYRF